MYKPSKRLPKILLGTVLAVVVVFAMLRLLMPPIPEEIASLQGRSMYESGTSGTAVILFHGLSASPPELLPIVRSLKEHGHTVYVPLLKGHGGEPKDLKGVTWQDWYLQAEETYDLARASHQKVYVGGISMGADLALLLSQRHQNVDGVITIGAPMVLKNKKTYLAGLLKYILPYVAHPVSPEERTMYYQSLPPEAVAELIALIAETKANLGLVKAPLVMFQGMDDPTVDSVSAGYIIDHVRSDQRTLHSYDVTSHILVDKPELQPEISKLILAFVEGK